MTESTPSQLAEKSGYQMAREIEIESCFIGIKSCLQQIPCEKCLGDLAKIKQELSSLLARIAELEKQLEDALSSQAAKDNEAMNFLRELLKNNSDFIIESRHSRSGNSLKMKVVIEDIICVADDPADAILKAKEGMK